MVKRVKVVGAWKKCIEYSLGGLFFWIDRRNTSGRRWRKKKQGDKIGGGDQIYIPRHITCLHDNHIGGVVAGCRFNDMMHSNRSRSPSPVKKNREDRSSSHKHRSAREDHGRGHRKHKHREETEEERKVRKKSKREGRRASRGGDAAEEVEEEWVEKGSVNPTIGPLLIKLMIS
jgi:hypothetical protein